MKAIMMKVNYDPKYTTPHLQLKQERALYEPLHTRLTLTKEIYGPALPERKHLKETLEDAARRRIRQTCSVPNVDTKEIARIQADAEKAHIHRHKRSVSV